MQIKNNTSIKDTFKNIKIFNEIAECAFRTNVMNDHSREIKAFWIWSIIYSLPSNLIYNHGSTSNNSISRELLVKIFGNYGYQIFAEVKNNRIYFKDPVEMYEKFITAKSPEEVNETFGNVEEAHKEYTLIECNMNLFDFRYACLKVISKQHKKKKVLAEMTNVTAQTICRFYKKSKNKFKIFGKKVWEKVEHSLREDKQENIWCGSIALFRKTMAIYDTIKRNETWHIHSRFASVSS